MFKNLARGPLAAMPAAVAATPLAPPRQRLELKKAGWDRCMHARVAP